MNDGIGNSTLILEPVNETVSDAVIDDGLIKNITDVLENLLKNYDNNHRPGNQGEPAVIYCNIFIRSMGPFSELDMAYSMDTYFRQRWTDHRLRFDGYGQVDVLSLDMKMLDRIWKPDTYFHNGLNSYLHTITRPNKFLRINQEGDVSYSMRLTIKAKCPMQLHNFPMDIQSCPLMFGSCKSFTRLRIS
ncbi:GABRA4 (predicted) [Pycnogonum litorale]